MVSSDASSDHSSSSTHHQELDREEMLRQLAKQTLAQFDIDPMTASEAEEEDDGQSEEWEGIRSEASDQSDDDDSYSMAGSEVDFDDPEDLHQSIEHHQSIQTSHPQQQPELIVFQDPSRPSNDESRLNKSNPSERESFMASMLKKQMNHQINGESSNNRKRNSLSREDADEVKLEQLDRSLSNLVSYLTGPTKKTRAIELDTILSSTLPPVTKDKNPQRHPRKIKAGMARAELQRSLAADKEALNNGTIRSSRAKTLTKKQKRVLDGTDLRDRKERKFRTDRPLGNSKGPGGMIKLSAREIQITSNSHSKKHKR